MKNFPADVSSCEELGRFMHETRKQKSLMQGFMTVKVKDRGNKMTGRLTIIYRGSTSVNPIFRRSHDLKTNTVGRDG